MKQDYLLLATKYRKLVIEAVYNANSGHVGGALSICDILAVLYGKFMNVDVNNPKWGDRDRLVLSKGHASAALYAALSLRGLFDSSEMLTFRKINSRLQGHPNMILTPGVDMSTGSLGQGLSAANGMAIAAKIDKKNYRVYCICGDGELQEGQVWESIMTSSHYSLDNLTLIIDNNNLQIDGDVREIMDVNPINKKMESFGWNVIEIDGHDYREIEFALEESQKQVGPTAIICKTIKSKGVSFMENKAEWHGTPPNVEEYNIAISELNRVIEERQKL